MDSVGLGIGSVLDKVQGWIRFGDGFGAQLDFRVDTVQGWIRLRMDWVHDWIADWVRRKVGLGLGMIGCTVGLQVG